MGELGPLDSDWPIWQSRGAGVFWGRGGSGGLLGIIIWGKNMLEFFRERIHLIILEKEHAGLSGD